MSCAVSVPLCRNCVVVAADVVVVVVAMNNCPEIYVPAWRVVVVGDETASPDHVSYLLLLLAYLLRSSPHIPRYSPQHTRVLPVRSSPPRRVYTERPTFFFF